MKEYPLGLKPAWQSALASNGLSLRAMAGEIGISRTYLSEVISGKLPSEAVRLRLLNYFKGYHPDDLFGPPVSLESISRAVPCKRCQSGRTIKSGLFHGNQRYECKECGCVFIDNNAPFHGSLPVAAVVVLMEHFFAGDPLDSVRSLIEDSQSVSVTIAGLEKVIYRYARKAVRLAGGILPAVHPRWLFDTVVLSEASSVAVMDILDLESGFIISSDVIRTDYAEKDRESVAQKALRLTAFTPDILILRSDLSGEEFTAKNHEGLTCIPLTSHEEAVSQQYLNARDARTQIISRRLNFDSITNTRLIAEAWRIHYNFFSAFKPAGENQYNSWLDIVNAAGEPVFD